MHSFWCRHTSCDFLRKSFSTSENVWKSHYEALGIHPNATQSDVKTAYYKLSKIYHPDKNKGSDSAADKFRDITAAYEVLGNLKFRKLYDKGILHMPEPPSSDNQDLKSKTTDDYEHAKFYHSRNIPNRRASSTGPRKDYIYNFDEWAQEHYGSTFARRSEAKLKYENLPKNNPSVNANDENFSVCRLGLDYHKPTTAIIVKKKSRAPAPEVLQEEAAAGETVASVSTPDAGTTLDYPVIDDVQ